jgi:hypothetical protein
VTAGILTRLVAAFVLVVLAGLPVASVVCARECTLPVANATQDGLESGHCHKADATDAVVMNEGTPDGCALLALKDAATRERSGGVSGAAPLVSGLLHSDVGMPPAVARVVPSRTAVRAGTRCPSTSVPLRI